MVKLLDVLCFGRSRLLARHKHRLCCRELLCPAGPWTCVDERIASPSMLSLFERRGR